MSLSGKTALRVMIALSLIILLMSSFSFYKISNFQKSDWAVKTTMTDTQSQMIRLKELYYALSLGGTLEFQTISKEIKERNLLIQKNLTQINTIFKVSKKYNQASIHAKEVAKLIIDLEKENRKMTVAFLNGDIKKGEAHNKSATTISKNIIDKLQQCDIIINKLSKNNLQSSIRSNIISGVSIVIFLFFIFPLFQYLRKAKEMADIANKEKSQFLANMSHEIRTPLNGVIGVVDLLKNSKLNTNQKESLNIISKSSNHLLGLINDILDISKIEAGKLTLEANEFNLIKTIENACLMITPAMKNKKLAFPVYIDKSVPELVIGDSSKFTQVFVNVLNNAEKYTPSGQVSISVYTIRKKNELTTIRIDVEDTGVGIPKDKLKKIFKAFTQTDESDTRKYGGTGLGLTISRDILKSMNGDIYVKSKESQGSCFSIEFPFKNSNSSSAQKIYSLPEEKPIIIVTNNTKTKDNLIKYITNANGKCETASCLKETNIILKSIPEGSKPGFLFLDKPWDTNINEYLDTITSENPKIKDWVISLPFNRELINHKKNLNICSISWPYNKDTFLKLCQNPENFYIQKTKLKSSLNKNAQIQKNNFYNILLVEDNLINQKVATMMLNKGGHKVVIANNGKEAVSLYEKQKFDLILMDCQMPIMDGFEATKKIREIEVLSGTNKTPIIAMTASAFKKTKEDCFDAGMNGFITKPVKVDKLLEMLDQIYTANIAA